LIAGLEPVVAAELALAGVAYGWASTRVARWEHRHTLAFSAGLVAIAVALGPLDRAADGSLPGHMAQHLVLIFVAPPLLLAGAPLRLALATLPTDTGRALARFGRGRVIATLGRPAVALACFAAILLGTHVPAFYEAALRHPLLHATEHVLYLIAGLVLWAPVLAPAPLPRRLGPLGSVLYLLIAMFPGAVIGLTLMTATGAVFPSYGHSPAALGEQWRAGMVMWASGSAVLAVAIVGLGWRALVVEERRQRIRDAHAVRAQAAAELPGAPR
jgi:cytochrome c oxidase assembly factor CtaG